MKIIAIAGGSASGKTTLASHIVGINPSKSLLVSLDDYYFNKEEQIAKNGFCNFDHPLAFDRELLLNNIEGLYNTGQANVPKYCFKSRKRVGYHIIQKPKIMIIEGLYVIEFLKKIKIMSIFLEADSDLVLARRIKRDLKERNRKLESILEQYFNEVKPAYKKYIVNQKLIANVIVKNNSQSTQEFLSQFKSVKFKC